MMHFAFHCFVIILVTQNVTVNSENLSDAVTNSIQINLTEHNRSTLNMFWSRKADYATFGRILLILGIMADVMALTIPVFVYSCTIRYVHQEKETQLSHRNTTSRTSILKKPANKNKFYRKFCLKKVYNKVLIQNKKYPTENLNNSKEGEASARSSLNYPIHSSDVSLLTAVKRDCNILFPSSAEGKNKPVGDDRNAETNKSNKAMVDQNSDAPNELIVKDVEQSESDQKNKKLVIEDETETSNTCASRCSSSPPLSDKEKKESLVDNFSDNLKYYWPKYVTALQDPAILHRKNKKLLDYYKSNRLLHFMEENEGYDKTKKDSETTTTHKKVNSSSRYLRIDPPVNLDDPWISDEIRKKFNIPTCAPGSHKTMGSKDTVAHYSLCTIGTKSVDSHPPYAIYNSNDIQDKKIPPPFNLGKQSSLPPPVPHPVLAEERRMRLNNPQCFTKMNCFENEDNRKSLRKVEFGNKITEKLCSAVSCESVSSSNDRFDYWKDKINQEYQVIKKKNDDLDTNVKDTNFEKRRKQNNEAMKANTTVEITLPKRVDMSRPASVPTTFSDNLICQSSVSSKKITRSDVQNLAKTRSKDESLGKTQLSDQDLTKTRSSDETKELDSTHQTDARPPSVPKMSADDYSKNDSKNYKRFCKSSCLKKAENAYDDESSDNTIRELTFATPETLSTWKEKEKKKNLYSRMQDRPPTKKRIQQEEIRRKKQLAMQKKMEFHQRKREEQQKLFKKQREIQRQRYQLDKGYDASETTKSKPWELKDFLEYERKELLQRRAKSGDKMTDSLTSGSVIDRYSPYRLRFMDESFMESVRLGKERVYYSKERERAGLTDTISSGIESNDSTKLLGPVFVKNEHMVQGGLPEYVFYDVNEIVKPVKDRTFYTMKYGECSKTSRK